MGSPRAPTECSSGLHARGSRLASKPFDAREPRKGPHYHRPRRTAEADFRAPGNANLLIGVLWPKATLGVRQIACPERSRRAPGLARPETSTLKPDTCLHIPNSNPALPSTDLRISGLNVAPRASARQVLPPRCCLNRGALLERGGSRLKENAPRFTGPKRANGVASRYGPKRSYCEECVVPDWLWQAIIANWIWELLCFGQRCNNRLAAAQERQLAPGLVLRVCRVRADVRHDLHFSRSCHSFEAATRNYLGKCGKEYQGLGYAFQLGVTKLQPDPDGDFGLAIALKGGNSLEIHKLKQSPAYLQIQSQLVLSPEHQKTLAKLTEEQSAFVTEELSLELARSKIGFTIVGPPVQGEPQIQLVVLMKGVPISGLTESTFAGYMDEMDSAIKLSRTTTALLLDHGPLRDTATGPHPTPAR